MNWEEFRKWLEGKFGFQLIILGASFFLWIVASSMSKKTSSEKLALQSKYRHPEAPEYCYCRMCGSKINMREYGLYGMHCREIEFCPKCGAGGHPLWRTPR